MHERSKVAAILSFSYDDRTEFYTSVRRIGKQRESDMSFPSKVSMKSL